MAIYHCLRRCRNTDSHHNDNIEEKSPAARLCLRIAKINDFAKNKGNIRRCSQVANYEDVQNQNFLITSSQHGAKF